MDPESHSIHHLASTLHHMIRHKLATFHIKKTHYVSWQMPKMRVIIPLKPKKSLRLTAIHHKCRR